MQFTTKLHSSIFHPTLRKWQEQNVDLSTHNLMLPIFIVEDDDTIETIDSMPDVKRYGLNKLKTYLTELVEKGLTSVLLFGVISLLPKDNNGISADSKENPIVKALPKLREWFPNLVIACDVCLCPYTNHGHCGVLQENELDNSASISRLAEISLTYARAGAHIIAPSDMMDNRILSIKTILSKHKLDHCVAVLSYAAKFASCFYGPFREAAKSTPGFGDRKSYQLPPGSKGLAARAVKRDIEEGADMIMVKPGLPYLDIVKQTKDSYPHVPLFIYQVSGEYAMIVHAAANGALDLKSAVLEALTSMRRAGGDCIISYFTPLVLDILNE